MESVRHARTRLNIWEVHSPTVRDKCLSTARALCFVVDCTEDAVGIGQGAPRFACGMIYTCTRVKLDSTLVQPHSVTPPVGINRCIATMVQTRRRSEAVSVSRLNTL